MTKTIYKIIKIKIMINKIQVKYHTYFYVSFILLSSFFSRASFQLLVKHIKSTYKVICPFCMKLLLSLLL